jgi:4-carboxymuconolactone decarboxylase
MLYEAIVSGHRGNITDLEGHLLGPLNAMLYSPVIGLALQGLGAAIRFEGSLSDRAREIAILAVAAHQKSDYEWSAHAAVGREVGLRDMEIEAIRAGRTGVFANLIERDVLHVTLALLNAGDLGDADYAEAEAKLGAERLVELTTLIGYYSMIAMQLRVFRVAAPDVLG